MLEAPGQSVRRDHRRTSRASPQAGETRKPNYRELRNPFRPQGVFSDDQIAHMHETALRVLEELGMLVLLPEARAIFKRGGARVDEATQSVWLGRDIVTEALARDEFHHHPALAVVVVFDVVDLDGLV